MELYPSLSTNIIITTKSLGSFRQVEHCLKLTKIDHIVSKCPLKFQVWINVLTCFMSQHDKCFVMSRLYNGCVLVFIFNFHLYHKH